MADAHVEQSVTDILNRRRSWLYDNQEESDADLETRLEELEDCDILTAQEVVARYRCGL